jgi:hypothetical protein
MPRGRVLTAEVEEASVVVVLAVVAMSAAEAEAAARGQLEAEAVSVAVASAQQPRRSVARADPSEWDRAEAELASACRVIGGLSTLMDELAAP